MHPLPRQDGTTLIVMLIILLLGITALLTKSSGFALQNERGLISFNAMARAKEALISDAVTQTTVASAGHLRLPDLGFKVGNIPSEGSAAPNFSGNGKDYTVMGKLPWRTLGLDPLLDGEGECLWYAASGRFKNMPATDALNWDTQGQIDLADENGNIIASNLAAVIAAPGAVLSGQDRALSSPAYAQCRGNYDARNYLDPHDSSGTVNYFAGSTNNRVAADTGNKLMVMAGNSNYNDRFLAITSAEIFHSLIRRADFSAQVSALMDDAYFQTVSITGSKGTDGINCKLLASGNQNFCRNWKEMLLLTQLPVPAAISIDSMPSTTCTRVLIFGGQRNPSQSRLTATDKSIPANYVEGANLFAFASPVANTGNFTGYSTFNANSPEADLLRCLP